VNKLHCIAVISKKEKLFKVKIFTKEELKRMGI
jgi:hypothetical protein